MGFCSSQRHIGFRIDERNARLSNRISARKGTAAAAEKLRGAVAIHVGSHGHNFEMR